jgi:hypothetical protein
VINSRSMLQALVYVLEGRADWLERKAESQANRSERKRGRASDAGQHHTQADAVKRIIHGAQYGQPGAPNVHEYKSFPLPPALVGLALAYAAGNMDVMAELRREMRSVEYLSEINRLIDALIALRVLPTREKANVRDENAPG